MFYPVGSRYTRALANSSDVAAVRALLCKDYDCAAGMLAQPFGEGRGRVLAQRSHMLVLAFGDEADLIVVPTQEIQNLLWSFSNGYAAQWSTPELHALTGCERWDDVLQLAGRELDALATDLARAIAGKGKELPVAAPDDYTGEMMELPSDYLHSMDLEGESCAH